ncbi:DENN domain-containing protein 3 [Notechis scutatus]|uniref:DENN domain-containing protein 3 n=1 Tax=Notechis scutatus TaxID=8663 RepID=A0A6J1VGB5_9SAUR|nr:DENN domain-containing protein 3 [Notechis scutatus]
MDELLLPTAVLEVCILVGVSREKARDARQLAQQKDVRTIPLEPEVLSVFVPPFISKEDLQALPLNSNALNKTKRRSFRKRKDKFKTEEAKAVNGAPKTPEDEDITVPKDVDLNGLPQLCFPGGFYITGQSRENHFHFLVFTDVFGNRTYGVVAQYYQPMQEGRLYNGQAHWDNLQSSRADSYFVPFAVCVISKYPYFNALKDCLSCLLLRLKPCKDSEIEEQIKEFAAKLSLIPSSPPGQLHLLFNMKPLQVVFPSQEDPDSPLIDLDLHLPFLCFKPEQILQILTCILTERKIVFFCSDWALLTLVSECFMLYIHPLQWQHTFVPILSHQMLDFVMAPTSFLMGCHIDHFAEVCKEADDLILINIDSGDIAQSKSSEEETDIPDVPAEAARVFITRSENLQLHYDLELCHLGTSTDFFEIQGRRRTWQHKLNSEIQQITLQLIVNMFREVKDHLNYEHRVFNSEEFLKTRAINDQPFYRKVLETYMFHSFLKARLNGRMDAFAYLEQSTQNEEDRFNFLVGNPRRLTMEKMISKRFNPQYMLSRRMGVSLPDLHNIKPSDSPMRNLSLRSVDVTQAKRSISKPTSTFKIPDIHFPLLGQSVQSYYVDLGNHLSRAIQILSPENSALLARYFYLRGLVNLMQRKFLNALSDFQNLYKTDIRIFPTDLVRKMIENLPPLDRSQADQKPELKRLISHLLDKQREVTKADDHVKKFALPKTHMQVNDFVKRIQESGIVKDTDTIHRLFDALTVGKGQKQKNPETFKDFYTYWKETEAEAQDVNLPPSVIEHLDKNECVYKLSNSVKTNKGVGKIALTPKRLFLLMGGACPGYQDIATFRDIEEVRNTTVTFLLLKIPTLKIRVKYKKDVFEANLKSECDLWHLMVKEMCAGKKMADDHKDPQYLQQALTNVLLMDAVVGSLQSSKIIYAASKLSYFDRMKNEVPMMVPKTTSETLKHKINPSAGETFPQAVEVLLYTPGQLEPTEKHGDAHPKLWCALNGGKVVVFDASTWSLQHSFKVGNSKLKCMIMAEQSQVWIGSADSVIYLINTYSMSCNKQLNDHRREIVDIVVDTRESLPSEVYSCSVDGTVIAWNISSLKVNRRFQLPLETVTSIQFYKNRLWCCIQDYIAVVSTNGLVRQKVKLENVPLEPLTPLLCFQLFPERGEVWASWAGSCELLIWNMEDFSTPLQKMSLQDCSEITCMIKVKNQVP